MKSNKTLFDIKIYKQIKMKCLWINWYQAKNLLNDINYNLSVKN